MYTFLVTFFLLVSVVSAFASASAVPLLRPGFYAETCPEAEFIVRDVIKRNMIREARSVASVMRFQFHDCFVNVNFITYQKLYTCFHFYIASFFFSFLWRF